MQELVFQDSAFDLSDSKKYKISIQASLDGFSLLMLHAESCQVHRANFMPITLSNHSGLIRKSGEIIEKLGLTGKDFHDVTVYLSDRQVKLIPAELYNEKTVKRILTAQWPGSKKKTATGMMLNDDYYLAFSIDSGLLDFFSEQFQGCIIKHEALPLISNLLKTNIVDSCTIHAHFHTGYFFVSVVRGNQLLFFNAFEYQSPDDIVYYLASSIQAIDANEPNIMFSGNIPEDSNHYRRIKSFFPSAMLSNSNLEILEATGWSSDTKRFLLPVISDQL